MALSDFTPIRKAINIGGANNTTMHLRGLTLNDLSTMFNLYATDMRALFDIYKEGAAQVEKEGLEGVMSMLQMAVTFVQKAPGLVATAIALAADEPDATDMALMLNPEKQVEILTTIADLTLGEGAGVKKLFGSVMALWNGSQSATEDQ